MSKAHRGTGIRKEANHGRGTCPVCNKSGVKVLYDQEVDGKKVKICKVCKAALKNKAQKDARLAKKAAAAEAPAAEAPAEA
ncbi:MAG: hypothetical protein MJZ50_07925 [Treponema sp.]|nr:hypothetical protein [Treponema sp.]